MIDPYLKLMFGLGLLLICLGGTLVRVPAVRRGTYVVGVWIAWGWEQLVYVVSQAVAWVYTIALLLMGAVLAVVALVGYGIGLAAGLVVRIVLWVWVAFVEGYKETV